ncbi:hypothetical protein [Thalassobius sp. I31.1]|nr:hypothetical protein [Thalassobius sp. I31.1]
MLKSKFMRTTVIVAAAFVATAATANTYGPYPDFAITTSAASFDCP